MSDRVGLRRFVANERARTDVDFNKVLDTLNDKTMIDSQGVAASMPGSAPVGTIYVKTDDNNSLFRHNGTNWIRSDALRDNSLKINHFHSSALGSLINPSDDGLRSLGTLSHQAMSGPIGRQAEQRREAFLGPHLISQFSNSVGHNYLFMYTKDGDQNGTQFDAIISKSLNSDVSTLYPYIFQTRLVVRYSIVIPTNVSGNQYTLSFTSSSPNKTVSKTYSSVITNESDGIVGAWGTTDPTTLSDYTEYKVQLQESIPVSAGSSNNVDIEVFSVQTEGRFVVR